MRNKLKGILIEAIVGFIFWTTSLTPYTLIVMQVTLTQYLQWVLMEAILVPPLAILAFRLTYKVKRRVIHNG